MVNVGGIINAPMVGRIYFSEVKKTITKDELLANKEFIAQVMILKFLLISVATDVRHLVAMSQLTIVALISLSYEE